MLEKVKNAFSPNLNYLCLFVLRLTFEKLNLHLLEKQLHYILTLCFHVDKNPAAKQILIITLFLISNVGEIFKKKSLFKVKPKLLYFRKRRL